MHSRYDHVFFLCNKGFIMYEMLWIMQMCISSKEIYGIGLYEKRGRMIKRKKGLLADFSR